MGVEARLALAGLDFRGKRYETVRQLRNRARRRGVVAMEIPRGSHSEELESLHAAWLESKRPSWRMKLLVGSPGTERPFHRRYFVARTADRIEAFATLLPGAPGTWGLDVVCRRPDAVAGSVERMLLHAIGTLQLEGATELSLGPCPMARVPTRGDRVVLRWLFRWLFASRLGNHVFGFRNLYRFKEKFRPRWEPVYFAARPRLSAIALYRGCRMWGLL